ncbi:hypothetical protein GCM10009727_58700 [Actinomadura napierensis]|uniref:Uncharacterized protein n=2 Tax=Actinomadura napierensis TaxID=267854 RepID=A0ABN3A2R3_9ACTN
MGADFAGIGLGVRLLETEMRDFVICERNPPLGGTWYEHTYPGCGCDVPTHLYSYSFAPNPAWTRAYPGSPRSSPTSPTSPAWTASPGTVSTSRAETGTTT